jgi:hypothetical protein
MTEATACLLAQAGAVAQEPLEIMEFLQQAVAQAAQVHQALLLGLLLLAQAVVEELQTAAQHQQALVEQVVEVLALKAQHSLQLRELLIQVAAAVA